MPMKIAIVVPRHASSEMLSDFFLDLKGEDVHVDTFSWFGQDLLLNTAKNLEASNNLIISNQYDFCINFTTAKLERISSLISARRVIETNYGLKRKLSFKSLLPILLQSSVTPFCIEVVNSSSSIRGVFANGQTETCGTWKENDRKLLKLILFHLTEMVKVEQINLRPSIHTKNSTLSIRSISSITKICKYFSFIYPKQILHRILIKFLGGIYRRKASPTWHIAHTFSNPIKDSHLKLTHIKNPNGFFLADPFVVRQERKSFCFVEQYDNAINRGHISVFQITSASEVQLIPILVENFHMSFPFIFEYLGDHYMCPETSRIGEIRLYKATQFPFQWNFYSTLMKSISAADTMIFEMNGKWWMFTNIDRAGLGTHNLELHIYFSDSPLSNSWRPHKLNPIYQDSLIARNGGLMKDATDTYRISQIQGFAQYGEGIRINRIVELNENEYTEVEVKRYVREFAKNSKGNHHMYSDDGIVVLDYFA